MAALPTVKDDIVNNLCLKLVNQGVMVIEDLEFVETKDMEDLLPPIQCRKLVQYIKDAVKRKNDPVPDNFFQAPNSTAVENNLVRPSCSYSSVAPSAWAEDFKIDLEDFPKELLSACKNKTRPQNKHVSDMIRNLVAKIMKIEVAPGRKNLRIIAQKVVDLYPDTFQDTCMESVIAGGSVTIMKKLEDCIDNRKRRNALAGKFASSGNEDLPKTKKRKSAKDSLGCINWQPADLSPGETRESQEELQAKLIAEFEKDVADGEFVSTAMSKTYATQRFYINQGKPITEIRKEWPYLLEEKYLISHFQVLVGKDISKLFVDTLPKKCIKIYEYMKAECNLVPKVKECLKNIEQAKVRLGNLTPEIFGSFLLLLAYFGEEEKFLFQTFQNDLLNTDDVENQHPVLTPFIGIFGEDIYSAPEYVVFLDGKAATYTNNIFSAMAVLYASYFVFNIEYPAEAYVTMEFIQRVFAEMNPDRGTKCPKNKNIVLKKILKLTNKLMTFQNAFNLEM